MSELVTWLREQIDVDKAMARAAQDAAPERSGCWHAAYSRGDLNPSDWLVATAPLSDAPLAGPGLPRQIAEHIARWGPARVLAECAAKQAVMDLHSTEDERWIRDQADECPSCHVPEPCDTALAMAKAYADRPGYDPAWTLGDDPPPPGLIERRRSHLEGWADRDLPEVVHETTGPESTGREVQRDELCEHLRRERSRDLPATLIVRSAANQDGVPWGRVLEWTVWRAWAQVCEEEEGA